ncbi:Nitrogen permease reactivator protein [Bulinus truncatus]|nr:Nitrogen permease reactivator protein [Bulinus truncatus]
MESTGALGNLTSFHVNFLRPLLDIAMEDSRAEFGQIFNISYRIVETLPGPQQIGALAAKEYYRKRVDVFFGPVSNEGQVTLCYMSQIWNIPVVSPRGNDPLARNGTLFPISINLHPFDKASLVYFTRSLCQKYGWIHVSMFVDVDKNILRTTGEAYEKFFVADSNIVLKTYKISTSTISKEELEEKFQLSSASSRVNILLMDFPEVRHCLLIASALGMTSQEYLYIVPNIIGEWTPTILYWQQNDTNDEVNIDNDTNDEVNIDNDTNDEVNIDNDFNEEVNIDNDTNDEEAKKAFQTVLIIDILRPTRADFIPLLKRLNEKMFGQNTSRYVTSSYDDEEDVVTGTSPVAQQFILTAYYNAFNVYLTALYDTFTQGGNMSDGLGVVHRIRNTTIKGIAGEIQIDISGNRAVNLTISDMTDEQNGRFTTVGRYNVLKKQLTTESRYTTLWPAGDTYLLDVPACGYLGELCPSSTGNTVVIASSVLGCLMVLSIFIIIFLRIQYRKQSRDLYWWRIHADDLQPIYRTVTKSNFSNNISQIRDISHTNLLHVIGAVLEGDKKIIIVEHCPKGSLQNGIPLSARIVFPLVELFLLALSYLHKSPLRVHGRLTSEVCMIDSRFSVKVGFYGLPTINGYIKLLNGDEFKDQLWAAPEMLRHGGKPTQQGDVYSLAIIISEMLTREEPYSQDQDSLSTKEIIDRVKSSEAPPFRPTVVSSPDLLVMDTLMRRCWEDEPEKRPAVSSIVSVVDKLMAQVNKSGGLVDNLLQRLEKYSSNLEKIVDEKVDELKLEKEKSEGLLKQMLPAPVVERLKSGLGVEPEYYDCVTIYFSDIVEFTVICSLLAPVQIISLLNDLYSCFDQVLGNFDVYKVETIGDAYMVVSGLPTRNGNEHARQIAQMSLSLLTSVSNFTHNDLPQKKVKLRIGLNSGPVCAGVVGLKMPRYCLFGDSVNTASRMESNSEEFKIHMSGSTASILQTFGTFVIESRGEIQIKFIKSRNIYLIMTFILKFDNFYHLPIKVKGTMQFASFLLPMQIHIKDVLQSSNVLLTVGEPLNVTCPLSNNVFQFGWTSSDILFEFSQPHIPFSDWRAVDRSYVYILSPRLAVLSIPSVDLSNMGVYCCQFDVNGLQCPEDILTIGCSNDIVVQY